MNADQKMQKQLNGLREARIRPKLLLNSCCGPCSTSVLEQLTAVFEVTVHFYNPNIHSQEEYSKRLESQKRVLEEMTVPLEKLLDQGWIPGGWNQSVSSIPFDKEGGIRCRACIGYRMDQTAKLAAELSFDWFTTTLSVSPHKDSQAINEMGMTLENKYKVKYLFADFKKRGGYQRSVMLAKSFGLYRQDHCGCVESLQDQVPEDREKVIK